MFGKTMVVEMDGDTLIWGSLRRDLTPKCKPLQKIIVYSKKEGIDSTSNITMSYTPRELKPSKYSMHTVSQYIQKLWKTILLPHMDSEPTDYWPFGAM